MEKDFKFDDGLPEKYYKYQSLNGAAANYLINTLVNRQIHFSSPKSFNDPFDCKPVFENNLDREIFVENYIISLQRKTAYLSESYLRGQAEKAWSVASSASGGSEAVALGYQKFMGRHLENSAIYCVSEIKDDLLMWAHYADSHRGICLEFSPGSDFLQAVLPVDYRLQRPQIKIFDRTNELANAKNTYLTKSIHWAYEKEWRVVEVAKPAGLREFNDGDLTGIIFGSAISKSMENTIRSIIEKSHMKVQFYRAVVDNRNFRLNIEKS